jgi:ABC-2 type transport system ATP-binding protein
LLRAGHIIETGRLDVLRRLASIHVRAELDGPAPDVSHLEGVSNAVGDGNTIECNVSGPMETLLRTLAEVGVRHMTTREPSLEELFMAHYGSAPDGSTPDGSTNGDAG